MQEGCPLWTWGQRAHPSTECRNSPSTGGDLGPPDPSTSFSEGPKLESQRNQTESNPWTENSPATPERWPDGFRTHNTNVRCLPMLYFVQLLSEREVRTGSPTGSDSGQKITGELVQHNANTHWEGAQSQQRKPSSHSASKRARRRRRGKRGKKARRFYFKKTRKKSLNSALA